MAKTYAGIINAIDTLCNEGMSNRENWWFRYILTPRGRKEVAREVNRDRIWMNEKGLIEIDDYRGIEEARNFTGPVAYIGGCWNCAMPYGGTFWAPSSAFKRPTKMKAKHMLRRLKEKR